MFFLPSLLLLFVSAWLPSLVSGVPSQYLRKERRRSENGDPRQLKTTTSDATKSDAGETVYDSADIDFDGHPFLEDSKVASDAVYWEDEPGSGRTVMNHTSHAQAFVNSGVLRPKSCSGKAEPAVCTTTCECDHATGSFINCQLQKKPKSCQKCTQGGQKTEVCGNDCHGPDNAPSDGSVCPRDCQGSWVKDSCNEVTGTWIENFEVREEPSNNGAACPTTRTQQGSEVCAVDCVDASDDVGNCGEPGTLKLTRTWTRTVEKKNGGQECGRTDEQYGASNSYSETVWCDVDCSGAAWSEWSEWSPCDSEGTKSKTRHAKATQAPKNNGERCQLARSTENTKEIVTVVGETTASDPDDEATVPTEETQFQKCETADRATSTTSATATTTSPTTKSAELGLTTIAAGVAGLGALAYVMRGGEEDD